MIRVCALLANLCLSSIADRCDDDELLSSVEVRLAEGSMETVCGKDKNARAWPCSNSSTRVQPNDQLLTVYPPLPAPPALKPPRPAPLVPLCAPELAAEEACEANALACDPCD
jgi:hypothetical protein